MDATPFELCCLAEPVDIDLLGRVNNVVYLRWVQDAAVAHWRALATPQEQAALLWMVVRHEIDCARPFSATWSSPAPGWARRTRRNFERHTELLREADGQLLAKARTLWCPVDSATRKAVAVDDALRARFSVVRAD